MVNLYYIANIITYLSPIILLIGSIMGITFTLQKKYNVIVLTIYFIAHLFIDSISRICSILYGSNLIFINLYALCNLIILYFFINSFNSQKSKISSLIFYFLIAFNLYELLTLNFKQFELYQSYSNTINSIFLLILIVLQFQKNININSIHTKIRILLLSYFSINSLLNLPLNLLINYTDDSIFLIWLFNMINTIVLYCFLIYYLWKCGKIQKP